MITWVIYDISCDKSRTRIAKLCQQAGLYRVQESVFLGDLDQNRCEELFLQFAELIDPDSDSIYFSPIARDSFDSIRILGQGFDRELVGDTCKLLFF